MGLGGMDGVLCILGGGDISWETHEMFDIQSFFFFLFSSLGEVRWVLWLAFFLFVVDLIRTNAEVEYFIQCC